MPKHEERCDTASTVSDVLNKGFFLLLSSSCQKRAKAVFYDMKKKLTSEKKSLKALVLFVINIATWL